MKKNFSLLALLDLDDRADTKLVLAGRATTVVDTFSVLKVGLTFWPGCRVETDESSMFMSS